ncbi:uncharacterized protein N7477_005412 [Penicillium maclennaniae]|uniref:uncharacterized protein n=1 Tax=Penicillium maclennaniae TaxID=1343394 RepID=UPI0025410924|nr:uncharacterized protein N7477_005412 [Penicillium maclennaniae]KAJ5670049.1 hypothetical protein N7477_005412 [Penicillium maclennaniae]
MGDYGPAAPSVHSTPVDSPAQPQPIPSEISVLITGFGPFKTNLVNASYLIASSLPSSFDFSSPKGANRRVSLHVHPTPISVAYATVREALPNILKEYAAQHGGRPDIVLHIGIASPRPYYSVESLAHRDGYFITDIQGRTGFEDGERRWKELGLPPTLTPGSESGKEGPYPPDDHFLETWRSHAPPETDLRISEDPGHYLCDFIFYTSLSLALMEGQDRNVVFLHVPAASQDADIDLGRNIAMALIKTLVTCWIDENRSS